MPTALASTCIRAILIVGTICAAAQAREPQSSTDALPLNATGRLGTLRMRHGGEVVVLAFSPDGEQILSGGGQDDFSVYLWDLSNGERLMRLPMETGAVAVAFSPDGSKFAAAAGLFSGDADQIVHVWDAKTGRELHRRDVGKHVRGLTFARGSKVLAVNGCDDMLLLWEFGKTPRALEGKKGYGNVVAYSPDGKLLAAGSTEYPNADFRNGIFVIRLWDVESGKVIYELHGHEESIRALAFSPDGKVLASGGCEASNTVRLWNVTTGKELTELERREGDTRALRFSQDGRTLHAADHEGRLRAWRLADGKALPPPVLLQEVPHASDAVAFSPAGDRLAMGCWVGAIGTANNSVNLWDVATGKRLLNFPGHAASVKSLAFSADGKHLASCGGDGVIFWDVAQLRPLRRFGVRTDWLTELALSADGSLVAVRGDREGRVRLLETNSGKERAPLTWKRGEDLGRGGGLQFSPNGQHLVVTEPECMLRNDQDRPRIEPARLQLWNIAGGRPTIQLPLTDRLLKWPVGFSPDGHTITTVSGAGVVRWDAATGKERLRLGRNLVRAGSGDEWAGPIALSPDARMLAVETYDGAFGLWETATGKETARLLPAGRKFEKGITAVAFSADSRLVVAGTRDGGLRCWNVHTGEKVAERAAHIGRIHALAFTTDCKTLASASADTTVLLWDLPGLAREKVGPPKPLDAKTLAKLWGQFEGEDGRAAYRSIAALEDADAVAYLNERFRQLRVDRQVIAALISRLDDDSFAEREKATAALKKLGTRAEEDLKRTLDRSPTPELRRRVEELLAEFPDSVASGERLRGLRALTVLERIGTPAARQLLEGLAQDAGDRVVRVEAAAAVDRLRLSAPRQP